MKKKKFNKDYFFSTFTPTAIGVGVGTAAGVGIFSVHTGCAGFLAGHYLYKKHHGRK